MTGLTFQAYIAVLRRIGQFEEEERAAHERLRAAHGQSGLATAGEATLPGEQPLAVGQTHPNPLFNGN